MVVDEKLQTMIHDNANEFDLEKHARKHTPSIRQDGVTKILEGITSIDEVMRVTREF